MEAHICPICIYIYVHICILYIHSIKTLIVIRTDSTQLRQTNLFFVIEIKSMIYIIHTVIYFGHLLFITISKKCSLSVVKMPYAEGGNPCTSPFFRPLHSTKELRKFSLENEKESVCVSIIMSSNSSCMRWVETGSTGGNHHWNKINYFISFYVLNNKFPYCTAFQHWSCFYGLLCPFVDSYHCSLYPRDTDPQRNYSR